MRCTKLPIVLSASLAALVVASGAMAQTTSPSAAPSPTEQTQPATPGTPMTPSTPASPPAAGETKPAVEEKNAMVGLPVFGSDGERVGKVASVTADASGKVTELEVATGGFLGFGTKTVKIPTEAATNTGQQIRLSMTSQQVSQLVK